MPHCHSSTSVAHWTRTASLGTALGRSLMMLVLLLPLAAAHAIAAEEGKAEVPWPSPVEGWKAPLAGEHPRLFFRRDDVAELKRRAATPEGKVIVARLRTLLGGGDAMPTEYNPQRGPQEVFKPQAEEGKTFTLWHAAGFGLLFELTGEKKYADLGRQCVEKMLEGQRDRDNRYSFRAPNGALRAGPSLGAMAMAYDLNYNGWDDDFRQRVAAAIQNYNEGNFLDLAGLVRGSRHSPQSNHWGCQVGGGALAVLAIWNDPGVNAKKIEPLLEQSSKAMLRQLNEGFGDGGMYWEGKGPGGIGSDTAFIPALQAWRVAGGRDFVTPRPNAAAITLIKLQELLTIQGEPWYPIDKPGGYGSGYFGARFKGNLPSDRDGLSRAGQFAQGFGAIPDEVKPVALWVYNHIVEPDAATRTYDTVSPYPHRPVLALVNWPIGVDETNPAEMMPKVHYDSRLRHYVFRNHWTGTEDDIVVNATFGARDPHPIMLWGAGQKLSFGQCPRGEVTHFAAGADGSGTVTGFGMALGVDFSKASGADALLVVVGNGAAGQQRLTTGGTTYFVSSLGGKLAEPKVEDNQLVIGSQTIRYDGKRITFDKFAAASDLPRLGLGGSPLQAPRPPITRVGEAIALEQIRYRPSRQGAAVEAKLHYRREATEEWTTVALNEFDGCMSGQIPASATTGALEYYVEVRDAERDKKIFYPSQGAARPARIEPDASPPRLTAAPRTGEVASYAVELAWTVAEDDLGVAGYEVHRAADKAFSPDAASLLAKLDGSQLKFRDDQPPAGTTTYYSVVPVDVAGRRGEHKTVSVAVPQDVAPRNGLELSVTSGPKANILSWRGELEPDVSQLIIARAAGDAEAKRIAVVDKPAATFRWVDREVRPDAVYRYEVQVADAGGNVSEARQSQPVTAGRFVRRINCGGKQVISPDGIPWEADDGVVTGTGRVSLASTSIAGAVEELQEVYASERWSYKAIRYAFRDLEPGSYLVVLHLAETNPLYAGGGKRKFEVRVNGESRHQAVDVFEQAKGMRRAWQFTTPVALTDDQAEIVVDLVGITGGPAVKGIEIREE